MPRMHCGPAQKGPQSKAGIRATLAAQVHYELSLKREIVPDTPTATRETILVVDDNAAVLKVVVEILKESARFEVLGAADGAGAIELANRTESRIDLLLSDVDMPLLSGPDLGLMLKKTRPDLRVMLMSGGETGNLLVLNYGWAFIQKPFVAARLVQMIVEVLNSPDQSQSGGQEFDSRKHTR